MQRPTDNPYERPSAYGRLPQKAFRIGSLPRTVAEPPRSFAGRGVITGSALPGPPLRAPSDGPGAAGVEQQITPAPSQAAALVDVGDLAITAPAPAATRPRGRSTFDLRIPLAAGGGLLLLAVAGILLTRGGGRPEDPVAPAASFPAPEVAAHQQAAAPEPVVQAAQAPSAPRPTTEARAEARTAARPAQRQAAAPAPPAAVAPPVVDVVEPAPLTVPTPAVAPPPVASPPPDPEAAMSTSVGG